MRPQHEYFDIIPYRSDWEPPTSGPPRKAHVDQIDLQHLLEITSFTRRHWPSHFDIDEDCSICCDRGWIPFMNEGRTTRQYNKIGLAFACEHCCFFGYYFDHGYRGAQRSVGAQTISRVGALRNDLRNYYQGRLWIVRFAPVDQAAPRGPPPPPTGQPAKAAPPAPLPSSEPSPAPLPSLLLDTEQDLVYFDAMYYETNWEGERNPGPKLMARVEDIGLRHLVEISSYTRRWRLHEFTSDEDCSICKNVGWLPTMGHSLTSTNQSPTIPNICEHCMFIGERYPQNLKRSPFIDPWTINLINDLRDKLIIRWYMNNMVIRCTPRLTSEVTVSDVRHEVESPDVFLPRQAASSTSDLNVIPESQFSSSALPETAVEGTVWTQPPAKEVNKIPKEALAPCSPTASAKSDLAVTQDSSSQEPPREELNVSALIRRVNNVELLALQVVDRMDRLERGLQQMAEFCQLLFPD